MAAKHALVADDEPALLLLIGATLGQLGLEVLTAANRNAALTLIGDHDEPIDLAVLDVTMPGMKRVVTLLVERHPSACILLVSGYPRQEALDALGIAEYYGIHFLQKPFTIQELRAAVLAMLDGRMSAT